jgi:hypothetical protein
MPIVLLQAQPETVEVALMTFEKTGKMGARGEQDAGEVEAFVVESPGGSHFTNASHRE